MVPVSSAKPSTDQVEMLAPPALRLSHLAHLIGAQFVGPTDPIIDGLARQDLAEEGDLVTFAEVAGQNDQKLRRSKASAVILRMNSNIPDLPMAVIRATQPDLAGVRAAEIIGGLGVGRCLRDLRRFHVRTSNHAPVLLFPSHAREFSQSAAWIGRKLRWWKNLSAEAREQPRNRWWISQLQDRIGIPFPDYSIHDDRFLLQLERYLHRLEAYRGEIKDSSVAVIPVRHPRFSVIAGWLDKQILWAGKMADNERREPANAWRLQQFETKLGLVPGSFGLQIIRGHLNQAFEKNSDQYLEDLAVYREEDLTRAHSLLIPLDHPTLAQSGHWIDDKMKWWRGLTDQAKAMPHNQWRIQQLKTKIGLPFAEYNRYDDGIRARCDRYIADRELYRAETSRRNSLLIPVTYPKYRTSRRWINEELAWWKSLSSEEREKPRNRWLIGLLKGPVAMPFPEYSSHDDDFAISLYHYRRDLSRYSAETGNGHRVIIPRSDEPNSPYKISASWMSNLLQWWRSLTDQDKKRLNVQWRLGLLQTVLGLTSPAHQNTHETPPYGRW